MEKSEIINHFSTRFSKEKMIDFVRSNPKEFSSLVELATENEYPASWRSCWVLTHTMEVDDKRISSFIDNFLDVIEYREDGHKREIIKLLNRMILDEDQEAKLFNICMNFWENISNSSSLRLNSIKFVLRVMKKFPELGSEIEPLLDEKYIKPLTPGVKKVLQKEIG